MSTSNKPTIATLAARLEQLETLVQEQGDEITSLRKTVDAQEGELADLRQQASLAHGRLDAAREYLLDLKRSASQAPTRRATDGNGASSTPAKRAAPVPADPALRIYTLADGTLVQYQRHASDPNRTTRVEVLPQEAPASAAAAATSPVADETDDLDTPPWEF